MKGRVDDGGREEREGVCDEEQRAARVITRGLSTSVGKVLGVCSETLAQVRRYTFRHESPFLHCSHLFTALRCTITYL